MIRLPLLAFALLFALGIITGSVTNISSLFLYLFLLVFLVFGCLSYKRGIIFDILLSCFVFTSGAALLKNSQRIPDCHILKLTGFGTEGPYIVKGFVNSEPKLNNGGYSFLFRTQSILAGDLNSRCCGDILVRLSGQKELRYGEGLILRGKLSVPFGGQNSRRLSYRDYLKNQGIFLVMRVKNGLDARVLNENHCLAIKQFSLSLKKKIEDLFKRFASPVTAGILGAMILGEKSNVPRFLSDYMMKTGTLHILVVSGFNVGIVVFVVGLLLRLLRFPRVLRLYCTIPCLIIYCLMTGASNPVVRATVMAIFLILGPLIKREPDIYNSLSIAWLFILALNPKQLFDIGFQLSFASVISIVYIYPRLKSLLRLTLLKFAPIRLLLDGLLVSFSAWMGTAGFIAHYFKIFSPVTVLANILIVPLATLITLCGFATVFVSLSLPLLTPNFGAACELLSALLIRVNAFLVALPLAYLRLS